jgi:hypothetical protein
MTYLNAPVVAGMVMVGLAAGLFMSDTEMMWTLGLTVAGFAAMGYGVLFHKSDDHKSSGKISRHWEE